MKTKKIYKTEVGERAIKELYQTALSKWPVKYEELFLDTEYGKTFVLAVGNSTAPPLILLHGASSNSAFWCNEVALFSKQYRVYAVDRPGEPGMSEGKRIALKGEDAAKWLEQVIEALKATKVILCGLSLGGWSAIKYAIYKPETVAKLVLLTPAGIRQPRLSFIFAVIRFAFMGDRGIKKMQRLIAGDITIEPEVDQYLNLIAKEFKHRKDAPPTFTDEQLGCLTMPVLLIGGMKDVVMDTEKMAARFKKLVSSIETILLPDAYHALIGTEELVYKFLTDTHS